MSFETLPNIQIGHNAPSKAYGGYIYNLNYDIKLHDGPSALTLYVASEDGKFEEPRLSASSPIRIKIGNQVDEDFYAVSFEEKRDGDSKTLQVSFLDGSIILDQIFVGLHKQHGFNSDARSVNHVDEIPTYIPNSYPDAVSITQVTIKDSDAPVSQAVPPNQPKDLIIIGEEIHPCDTNKDLVFDKYDLGQLVYHETDPCDIRCNNETPDINVLRNECVNKTKFKVLDVNYTFRELLLKINRDTDAKIGTWPLLSPPITLSDVQHGKVSSPLVTFPLDPYRRNHIGTLREVLQKWCSELGFTFYWETSKDGNLHFASTTIRPPITAPDFPCIESKTHAKSIRDTVTKGCISHFSSEGKIITKDCQLAQVAALHCLTLRDLFTDKWVPMYKPSSTGKEDASGEGFTLPPTIMEYPTKHDFPWAEGSWGYTSNTPSNAATLETLTGGYRDTFYPVGVPVEKLEWACVCAFHDRRLRDIYILQEYYHLHKIADFQNAQFKFMDRFGGMQILRVYDATTAGTTGGYDYLLDSSATRGIWPSPKARQDFQDYGGFFVVARYNKQKHTEQIRMEEDLATNFMGRHWIRQMVMGDSGVNPELRPEGRYLGAHSLELRDIPFANFQHQFNSRVAEIAVLLKAKTKFASGNSFFQGADDGTLTPHNKHRKAQKDVKSLLYYERSADAWAPTRQSAYFTKLLNNIDVRLPYRLTKIAEKDLLYLLGTDVASGGEYPLEPNKLPLKREDITTEVAVFAMFEGWLLTNGTPGSIEAVPDPVEVTNIYEDDPIFQDVAQMHSVKLGLSSKKSFRYTVWGIPTETPAGASCLFNKDYTDSLTNLNNLLTTPPNAFANRLTTSLYNAPVYNLTVTQTQHPHVEIPKIQATFITPPPKLPKDESALKTTYQIVSQIDDYMIKALNDLHASWYNRPQWEQDLYNNAKHPIDVNQPPPCMPSLAVLKEAHDKFNKNLTFSLSQPNESWEFTVAGIDLPDSKRYKIADGLESINIQISDRGVFTHYRVGNSLFTPLERDVLAEGLLFQMRLQVRNELFTNALPPLPNTSENPTVAYPAQPTYPVSPEHPS